MIPDFGILPIDAIIKFAMEQYLKNVQLCKEIERLRNENEKLIRNRKKVV